MQIAIVDYGSGNLRSAEKSFERAAEALGGGRKVLVTDKAEEVAKADYIVLPGVGAFADCKRGLEAVPGMVEALEEAAHEKGRPFLGICVGMQLMARYGSEHGGADGLNWIDGTVDPIAPSDPSLKIPHMGWNELIFDEAAHPLFRGLPEGAHFYFVHSYHFQTKNPDDMLAHVDYGGAITAAVTKGAMVGVQFHPEKSQANGLALISNFLTWTP